MGRWLVVAVAVLLAGGIGLLVMKGGVAADYMSDASAVGGILEDGLGGEARYLKITLSGRHTYAEVVDDEDKVVIHRYDGGFPRTPKPNGRAESGASARSFTLEGVDFEVVGMIARDAASRTEGGVAEHVTLERETQLLFTVGVNVDGEYRMFPYTLEGEPLVEERLDFVEMPKAAVRRLEEVFGAKARIVTMTLHREHAWLEVMSGKSTRDTDGVYLHADGRAKPPEPSVSDGNPDELSKQIFALNEVDWAAVRRAVADAKKQLDAEPQSITIRRVQGALRIAVYARTERGATRTANYDARGTPTP